MTTPHDIRVPHDPGLSAEDAERLARLISALFEKWELSTEEKQAVLNKGFEGDNSMIIISLENTSHVRYLLTIHKHLKLLYPLNPQMRYQWIKRPNRFFQNRTPLAVIIEDGIAGIEAVRDYLQTMCLR